MHDIAILITCITSTLCDITHSALRTVERWCRTYEVSVNLTKTGPVMFTNKNHWVNTHYRNSSIQSYSYQQKSSNFGGMIRTVAKYVELQQTARRTKYQAPTCHSTMHFLNKVPSRSYLHIIRSMNCP